LRLSLLLLLVACGPKKLDTVQTDVGEPLVAVLPSGTYVKSYLMALEDAIDADDMQASGGSTSPRPESDGTYHVSIGLTDHDAALTLVLRYTGVDGGFIPAHGELAPQSVGPTEPIGSFYPEVSEGMALWRERFERWHVNADTKARERSAD
jgi:hypothetical protein